jgi:phage baseplate assembly protein W
MEKLNPAKAFLGVGWAFPPCAPNGATSVAVYETDIAQAIRIILSTDRGERLMRPEFGAGLRDFIFGPINQTTMQRIQTRVVQALIEWEPRVDVESVTVTSSRETLNLLLIQIVYRVRVTNTVQNLVYPFYLDEGSAP